MRISQYCYFGIYSIMVSIEEISRQVGMQPDGYPLRGSKSVELSRPLSNAWRIEAQDRNPRVDDQLAEIVARLTPRLEEVAGLVDRLRADPDEDGHGGATLQVVRYFDDPEGVEELGAVGPGGLAKMSGQHQLLGWHLDSSVISFMSRLSLELDVDEYG